MPIKKRSIGDFLKFALASGDDESDVDSIKAGLFFVRQVFSIVFGIVAGFLHLQGIATILGFGLASMAFSYYYVFKYKEAEEDKIENTEVYTEGLPVSLGEFMLTWILVHTVTL